MQNFIAEPEGFTGTTVTIDGDEHHHATRSCRVRPGEIIGVTDGAGKRVEARIAIVESRALTAEIIRDISGMGEPSVATTVALSLIKSARFELAAEKCTELGVRRIVPVTARRCTAGGAKFNAERIRRIVREAAKQSGRSWIPEVAALATVADIVAETRGTVLAALTDAEETVTEALAGLTGTAGPVMVIVGPEGDFTDEERDMLVAGGALPVSLGGLILRSETAAIAAVAAVVRADRAWSQHV